jgi:anti-sigma factor RsiW
MTCDRIRESFADYLAGDLDERTLREVRAHLAGCSPCRSELEELSAIWTKLGVLPQEQPGPAVREKFYGTLEAYVAGMEGEKEKPGLGRSLARLAAHLMPRRPVYQAVLATALLAVGLGGGFWLGAGRRPGVKSEITSLRQEVGDMRQMVALSLLRQPSSSDRLMGVSWAENVREPARPTLDALVRTLNEDSSVNVRLAAVDALYLFVDEPGVKKGLVDSLARQRSPLIQAALIDLLVSVREKRAVEALKALAADEKLDPGIRQKAETGIKELTL